MSDALILQIWLHTVSQLSAVPCVRAFPPKLLKSMERIRRRGCQTTAAQRPWNLMQALKYSRPPSLSGECKLSQPQVLSSWRWESCLTFIVPNGLQPALKLAGIDSNPKQLRGRSCNLPYIHKLYTHCHVLPAVSECLDSHLQLLLGSKKPPWTPTTYIFLAIAALDKSELVR